jgi:hypothetical protein
MLSRSIIHDPQGDTMTESALVEEPRTDAPADMNLDPIAAPPAKIGRRGLIAGAIVGGVIVLGAAFGGGMLVGSGVNAGGGTATQQGPGGTGGFPGGTPGQNGGTQNGGTQNGGTQNGGTAPNGGSGGSANQNG